MMRNLRLPLFFLLAGAALGGPACSLLRSIRRPPSPSAAPSPTSPRSRARGRASTSSEAAGRSGSIKFEFKSGKVGRGDLMLMVPKGGFAPAPAGSDPTKTMPQVLMINFVNAEGGVINGTMDPYTDPSCSCEVQTTFVGTITGNPIAGTFTVTPSGAARSRRVAERDVPEEGLDLAG